MNTVLGATLERTMLKKNEFVNTIAKHCELIKDAPPLENDSDVEVHVKLRPMNSKEATKHHFQSVFCFENVSALYYPSFQMLTDPGIDVHSFQFDGNHDEHTDHDNFFASSCVGILKMIEVGGIGAIFAYGQTGSGKTYTISGVSERMCAFLPFETHDVQITLLEVMGDVVRDLITGEIVKVMMDSKGNPVIAGKTKSKVVSNIDEAYDTIEQGIAARKTVKTAKNDVSSRSHFICQFKMKNRMNGLASEVKLIDLAGSERNSDTKHHDAERIKESAYINTSLMALKECIRFRSKSNTTPDARIPFRSSKLTILLKDVLDPNSKRPTHLVMVATMAPTIHDVAHSLDTFRYAAALKPAPPIQSRPMTAQTSSTPMAWTTSRLNTWIETQTDHQLHLDKLTLDDLNVKGDFVLPAWKLLYEMPEETWVKRGQPLSKDAVLELRLQYRSMFLKKRPSSKATEITSAYSVETIMLLEKEKVSKNINRQEEAMKKLAAKGASARLAASRPK